MGMQDLTNKNKRKKICNSITYTTGDPDLNIKHFNKMHGTDLDCPMFSKADLDVEDINSSVEAAPTEGEGSLQEATKRIVKRYYVRPQNVFCSTKTDILKVLAENEDENCSIYTLKNLEDHDDIQKLTSADIIYYYDDHVLYDKNKVQILDYKLSARKEEKRKKFTGDVEKVSETEFTKVYQDRLTSKTADLQESLGHNGFLGVYGLLFLPENRYNEYPSEQVAADIFQKLYDTMKAEPYNYSDNYEVKLYQVVDEENIEILDSFSTKSLLKALLDKSPEEDPLDVEFEGQEPEISAEILLNSESESPSDEEIEENISLNEDVSSELCCICGEPLGGYGNNPAPYRDSGKCCDACNIKFVIPTRIEQVLTQNIKMGK